MGRKWFKLSDEDGGLNLARLPKAGSPFGWREEDLERLLLLNPQLLDVADQLPLCVRGGGSPVMSPDQGYVDELGRLTVVELKSVRACLDSVAQAIAYADHWRMLPAGETCGRLSQITGTAQATALLGSALLQVRAWANDDDPPAVTTAARSAAGERAMRRLTPHWAQQPLDGPGSYSRQHWGSEHFPCAGSPARLVVIAPAFDDTSAALAEALSARMVAVELVRVEIVKAAGRIFVGWDVAHDNPKSEPTWRFLRRLWREPVVRDYFLVNGWADGLNTASFSLSARAAPSACFWFEATASEGCVYTVMPDGWYKEQPAERRKWRGRFLAALPDVDEPGRWFEWWFELPGEADRMATCALRVARAIQNELVRLYPHQILPRTAGTA